MLRLAVASSALALCAVIPSSVSAATFTVTSLADSGAGSLRAAVAAAGNGDTIMLPAGTITLTSGVISVPSANGLTMIGAGARQTVLSGNHASEVLTTSGRLSVSGVTFEDGAGTNGGAITTSAPLTLTDDAFVNNHASSGGAIDAEGPNNGTAEPLVIDRTLFQGNTVTLYGGALYLSALGTVAITDSTFAGNAANGESGVFEVSLANPNTTITATNDTFVGNSAPTQRGGVFRVGSFQTVRLRNDAFAGNGTSGTDNVCDLGGSATTISDGHNLLDVTDTDCNLTGTGDKTGTPLLLGTLGDHGGPTDTALPLAGSPLIDGGTNTGCPLFDQRSLPRPFGTACDVGAVEITPPGATTGTTTSLTKTSVTLNGVADGHGLAGTIWYFQWGPTTSYGDQTPVSTLAATTPTGVASTLAGLAPGTRIHYRLVALNADGMTSGADQFIMTPAGPPSLTRFAESARTWISGRLLPNTTTRSRLPVGTIFSFTASTPAAATFSFARLVPGRVVGRRCVAQTHHNQAARRCTRAIAAGSFRIAAIGGPNHVHFQGRLSTRTRLAAGSYTVTVVASTKYGKSKPATLRFTLVK
jgi:hypothetical protein